MERSMNAPGSAFVRIHDQDFFLRLFRCEERPLVAGRETCSAASAQPGFLHGFDHAFGLEFKRLFQRGESAVGFVFFNILGVDAAGKTCHIEFFQRRSFRGDLEAPFFGEGENGVHTFVVAFDGGIENGSSVIELDFDHRLGIAVPDASDLYDRRISGEAFECVQNIGGSGGKTAGSGTDFDSSDISP